MSDPNEFVIPPAGNQGDLLRNDGTGGMNAWKPIAALDLLGQDEENGDVQVKGADGTMQTFAQIGKQLPAAPSPGDLVIWDAVAEQWVRVNAAHGDLLRYSHEVPAPGGDPEGWLTLQGEPGEMLQFDATDGWVKVYGFPTSPSHGKLIRFSDPEDLAWVEGDGEGWVEIGPEDLFPEGSNDGELLVWDNAEGEKKWKVVELTALEVGDTLKWNGTAWVGGESIPEGGTDGQVLARDTEGDLVWGDAPSGLPDTTGHDGKVLTVVTGEAAWEESGLPALTDPDPFDTIGSNAKGAEAADATAWTSGGANGLRLWVQTRQAYYHDGNKIWYAYARQLRYTPAGQLYSVSAETRIAIETPVDIVDEIWSMWNENEEE